MSRRLITIGAALLAAGLGVEAGRFLLFAPDGEPRDVVVEVPDGAALAAVARQLAGAGVVSHPRYFTLLGQLLNADRAIQAGDYAFNTGMRPLEVLGRLTSGSVIQIAVTIPEGFTAREIAAHLEAQELMPAEGFLAAAHDPALIKELGLTAPSAEGYLFPSTYYITRRTTPEELARRMVQEFRNATREWDWTGNGRPTLTPHQVVTLASIIEKETSLDEERPLVAAVFYNRLRRRMPLQSDPTVIYGLAGFDGNLRKADLSKKTPYNTYVIYGLPPGPIANPGAASLTAALHPSPVDYLYFVSKNDGSHVFSSTLADHQRAVARYQLKRVRGKG
ncbi:MAG: endolytic transglycosylase MltG [Nitrospirota bacterium]